jgi:6-phosphogluconolactonase (cycloisomerase 2 family)
MIQTDPSGHFVLHVDLGLDQIFVWKFDDQTGVLTPNDPPVAATREVSISGRRARASRMTGMSLTVRAIEV